MEHQFRRVVVFVITLISLFVRKGQVRSERIPRSFRLQLRYLTNRRVIPLRGSRVPSCRELARELFKVLSFRLTHGEVESAAITQIFV